MALPDPLPDDPKRWEGWRDYNSPNCYKRLGFAAGENPSDLQIEENCRRLLVWWQKKLPLKGQLGNPVAQLLRTGLDDAPRYLSEARAALLDSDTRRRVDAELRTLQTEKARGELHRFITFSVHDGILAGSAEAKLMQLGAAEGFRREEIEVIISEELAALQAVREDPTLAPAPVPTDPETEFLRILQLSGASTATMTEESFESLIAIAENLEIDAWRADELIHQYLDEREEGTLGMAATAPKPIAPPPKPLKPAAIVLPPAGTPPKRSQPLPDPRSPEMSRDAEIARFRTFTNSMEMEMLFIPSGSFRMGSQDAVAAPDESPLTQVYLPRYFLCKHLVTNRLYERFDPSHVAKRILGAGDDHPVVYVTSLEAIRFCQWLTAKERRTYRLPTEAEWENAARGADGRLYPWGSTGVRGDLANFADRNTKFAWSDASIDDGFSTTSPVGSYPRGASPFGLLDMAGNVWEWCSDFYGSYSGGAVTAPTGSKHASQRVYRGGSWRSRFGSLRTTTRARNEPVYSFGDLGFRIVCECGNA